MICNNECNIDDAVTPCRDILAIVFFYAKNRNNLLFKRKHRRARDRTSAASYTPINEGSILSEHLTCINKLDNNPILNHWGYMRQMFPILLIS